MRILLVEDHEEIWDFLSRRLRRRGFEVVLAADGQEGVDKAGSDAPDIILLDMNLPIIDGWTAASMIKADGKTAHIPIIALTAHAMSGDREKAIAAGLRRLSSEAGRFFAFAGSDRGARRQGRVGQDLTLRRSRIAVLARFRL